MWLARRLPPVARPARRSVGSLLLALSAMAWTTQPARAGDLLVEEPEALHLQRFIVTIEWPAVGDPA